MKRLAAFCLFAALIVGGCLNGQNISKNSVSNVLYVHDDINGVGCWYFSGGGVSCLPDGQYKR